MELLGQRICAFKYSDTSYPIVDVTSIYTLTSNVVQMLAFPWPHQHGVLTGTGIFASVIKWKCHLLICISHHEWGWELCVFTLLISLLGCWSFSYQFPEVLYILERWVFHIEFWLWCFWALKYYFKFLVLLLFHIDFIFIYDSWIWDPSQKLLWPPAPDTSRNCIHFLLVFLFLLLDLYPFWNRCWLMVCDRANLTFSRELLSCFNSFLKNPSFLTDSGCHI